MTWVAIVGAGMAIFDSGMKSAEAMDVVRKSPHFKHALRAAAEGRDHDVRKQIDELFFEIGANPKFHDLGGQRMVHGTRLDAAIVVDAIIGARKRVEKAEKWAKDFLKKVNSGEIKLKHAVLRKGEP
jgi:hypothetical protein